MTDLATRQVYWKNKFDGRPVLINVTAFDVSLHSEAPWPVEVPVDPRAEREKELRLMKAADVKALAPEGAEPKTAADAIELILAAEFPAV